MLIAVLCDRGSPGATTTALALGAASAEPTVVVEADPYGGDIALRCTDPHGKPFPETPTVLTVATAARTSLAPDLVISYAHEVTGSTRLVPGHLSAEQSAGITDWEPLVRQDAAFFRPADPTELVGDATRAREELGWAPTVDFAEIVRRMVAADLS